MNLRRYIGIPYVTGGNSFEGCDCYTLCRLFNINELGNNLPDLSKLYKEASCLDEENKIFNSWGEKLKSNWQEVKEPIIGDVVLFNFYNTPVHCAVYIGKNLCIHASQGSTSHTEPLFGSDWERRMQGIIRWKS